LILFVSDIHFGRDAPTAERANEAALIACLRSYASQIEHLYLVGDVFDAFIEYRHLVPRGFIRFLALIAEWTDRGIPVTYLVGNHDPWHRDYFETELGVRIVFTSLVESMYGHRVYVAHGDGLSDTKDRYNFFKPVLRHPIPVSVYRNILPGDLGMGLARWVKHHFGNKEIVEETVTGLRRHAAQILAETDADTVIMGHSHQPEDLSTPGGRYINLGYWHDLYSFARFDESGLRLMHWNGTSAEELNPVPVARPPHGRIDPGGCPHL